MIKLIAIDLDGTLYNSEHKMTKRGHEAVQKAKESGIQPVIVTGRSRRGAENALETLGMDLPYICSAGALVRTGMDGETIHAKTFHVHGQLSHIIEFTREHGTGLIAETPEGKPYWFGPDTMNEIMDPLTAKEAYKSIRTYSPEKDFDRPLLKATIAAEPDLLAEAEKVVRVNCPSIHQAYSSTQYIDLTAKGVNKGSALHAFAERMGFQPSEIAAIGDQAIDLKMLKYAGLPIAMSNGVQQLKDVAAWIAPSNDEDGAAWAIEEIIKQNRDTQGRNNL